MLDIAKLIASNGNKNKYPECPLDYEVAWANVGIALRKYPDMVPHNAVFQLYQDIHNWHQRQTKTFEPPTAKEMAKSAGAALAGFIKSGGKVVDKAIRKNRYAICTTCEDLKEGRCLRCGCYMKIKTWLPEQQCKRGLW